MQLNDFLNTYKDFAPNHVDLYFLRASGKAIYKKYQNHSIYYGEMLNDKKHGKGKYQLQYLISEGLFYQDKIISAGEWQNDVLHGIGYTQYNYKINNENKEETYEGTFKNGIRDGFGISKKENVTYQGFWKNGQKHGKAIEETKDTIYKGYFKNGQMDGFGKLITKFGDKYEGEFLCNKKHGQGKQNYGNGDIYVGQFENGIPEGLGTYKWKDGSSYEGKFKNGLRHGYGVWVGQNQQKYCGEYVNDLKSGQGEYRWSSGNVYKGSFFNDKRHGFGEMQWIDGTKYKGYWADGKQDGEGEVYKSGIRQKKGLFRKNLLMRVQTDDVQEMIDEPVSFDQVSHTLENNYDVKEPKIGKMRSISVRQKYQSKIGRIFVNLKERNEYQFEIK